MIRLTDQYFWNFIFSAFFGALIVMATIILNSEARLAWNELTLVDYTLITLATWRLTRLFVYDTITKWFREQFWDVQKSGRGFVLEKPASGPRRTLADLLSCPWCVGVWMAGTVLFFYLLTAWSVFPIVMLAISAVASFLQILSNLVGHNAERAKKQCEIL
ncbi:DUF1360 domain-containing protein [Candidatus Kaiserbacteria bacterium]|nr:DUF1360 domain-containing protein [Candidatus Kaiserbacteria bacterium]